MERLVLTRKTIYFGDTALDKGGVYFGRRLI